MNETAKHTKLRLLNCEGMALQQEESLEKISGPVFETTTGSRMVYLLDAKGTVKCTLPTSRQEYVRPDNFDRRSANVANFFTILWDDDGHGLTVYHHPPRGKFDIPLRPAVTCAIIGCILGIIVSSLIWSNKTDTEEVSSKTVTQTIEPSKTAGATASFPENSVQTFAHETAKPAQSQPAQSNSKEREIEKIAYDCKKKLQSLDCTMSTVKSVEMWYTSLDSCGRDTAERYYPFKQALRLYRQFFTARDIDDIVILLHAGKSVFSPKQFEVIKRYGSDNQNFYSMRKGNGMSFDMPYKAGLIKP